MNVTTDRVLDGDFGLAVTWDILADVDVGQLRRVHHQLHWSPHWVLETDPAITSLHHQCCHHNYEWDCYNTDLRWTDELKALSTVTSTLDLAPLLTETWRAQLTTPVISTLTSHSLAMFREMCTDVLYGLVCFTEI